VVLVGYSSVRVLGRVRQSLSGFALDKEDRHEVSDSAPVEMLVALADGLSSRPRNVRESVRQALRDVVEGSNLVRWDWGRGLGASLVFVAVSAFD
jgi:hypothetical protein